MIQTYKTAPRDSPKLKIAIALKTKEFNDCRKFPERDILRTEIDSLTTVLYVIQAHEARTKRLAGFIQLYTKHPDVVHSISRDIFDLYFDQAVR